MKKKVIHLSYYFKEKSENTYSKNLYNSKSFTLNFYIYKHLYYALNLAKIHEEKIILDIGCGDGPFFPTLNKYGGKIIGLDFSFWMLSLAKNLINFKKYPLKKVILLNSEGHFLPIKDNRIDTLFCLETFEHIKNSEKLIDEIYRILKADGELIYSIPIEIGFSLIFRQAIIKLINFQDDHSYSLKELLRNGILKKPPKKRYHLYNNPKQHLTHKNFDWRVFQNLINKKFKQIKVIFSPFPKLKSLNPTVIIKAKKRLHS